MLQNSVLIVILLIVFSESAKVRIDVVLTGCAINEELKECGSACEPTCKNPVPFCRMQCISNVCQCVLGFVRHPTTGKCVPQNQCPSTKKCGANEIFTECGSACEPSCTNPSPMCIQQCIPNVCRCSTGFVRHSVTGKCVRQNECSVAKKCGANETFRECGTACEPSCSNPEPRMCTKQCIVDVCQCSQGFIRGPEGCIKKEHC
uniref:TIL domain-containing protein n=1 Tax=Caenorhabditis japonica TaxID=281687 RepID=A0A8R1I8W5_CAEJA